MNQNPVVFRAFRSQDLDEILKIQRENLWSEMSETERRDGFLSVEFSAEQFAEMHRKIPIVVAEAEGGVGGYLCTSTLDDAAKVPLLAQMLKSFDRIVFEGRPLSQYRTFIYGPVCVGRSLRGRGVVGGLYRELLRLVKGRFDVGVLFISPDNPRSMRAHQRLGIVKLSDFTFDQREFCLLGFAVPR